ncbi:MAG: hypothetical protein JWR76_400 [Mucilaginibacter sp.]|nr:hypothetical protein [Mucilaginibacter sp.]
MKFMSAFNLYFIKYYFNIPKTAFKHTIDATSNMIFETKVL